MYEVSWKCEVNNLCATVDACIMLSLSDSIFMLDPVTGCVSAMMMMLTGCVSDVGCVSVTLAVC